MGRVVARNAAAGMASQVAIKVLSFTFTVLVIRRLGVETYGQYAAVSAFGALFVSFADLGLSTYTVREVARRYLHGREITEPLLNHLEVAVRAFDPCLSCATHALGKMPLIVELVDADGNTVSSLRRD